MFGFHLSFDRPWYLLLLAVLPVLWWFSFQSLAALGRVRRVVALLIRTALVLLFVLALAETQLVRTSEKLTVIYLLDQSESIPKRQREAMIGYVRGTVERHRDGKRGDRAAVVVFGRQAAVEVGPIDDVPPLSDRIEAYVDSEFSNLEAAMKMAKALFPEDAAKRVVIVSDGNENMGDARRLARNFAESGIGIDVVPIAVEARSEIAVEKITIPADVRRGQPFDLRVVLVNNTEVPEGEDGSVTGKLRIMRRTSKRETLLVESDVVVPPGKTVIVPSVPETINNPDFYRYEAIFVPDDPEADVMVQNNRATAYTMVGGKGRVLIIEDKENRLDDGETGEFDYLVERLRAQNISVTTMFTDNLFTDLADLQAYDTVVLANVPKASGESVAQLTHFSDAQVKTLVTNTEQMGAGLVMLGGPNSFGVGGWNNSELEKAMPVDFQIKNLKIQAVGALALIMHAGEIAEGNHWQKVVAREALKALGDQDYCGILHYDWTNGDRWLWKNSAGKGLIRVGGFRQEMKARLDKMAPGDMPEFEPAMKLAAKAFAKLPQAAVKHMIIISDGDPSPPRRATIQALIDQGVKVTTVGINAHGTAGTRVMQKIASQTGGKYYRVNNAKALPKIYQKEVRRLARPLVIERETGFRPTLEGTHEMIQGIDARLPPINGFVMTQVKDSPLVEVSMRSPIPAGKDDNVVLASWTYGIGRAVAFTTDGGQRWATSWTGQEMYDKLFSQIIRWSMRPVGDTGRFSVAADPKDGKINVVVTAWDKDDEYLNFLDLKTTVVGPDMKPISLNLRQTAPGRYVGEMEGEDAGSYFVTINPGQGHSMIRAGVNVPYSAEYRDRKSDFELLSYMAEREPKGGQAAGLVIDPTGEGGNEALMAANSFRHDLEKATSSQDTWHFLLLIGGCLFFGDVFFRRVQVNFAWVMPILSNARDTLFRREKAPVESEMISRLSRRKAEVSGQIKERKAAARFAPDEDLAVDDAVADQPAAAAPETRRGPSEGKMAPQKEAEEDSYTSRLLKAKKNALKKR